MKWIVPRRCDLIREFMVDPLSLRPDEAWRLTFVNKTVIAGVIFLEGS